MNGLQILPTLAADPVGHVIDHPLWTNADGSLWFISNATVMLVLGALITMLLVIPAARRIATGQQRSTIDDFRSQGLLANLVETVCVYLRDSVFRPVLHDQTDRFAPILWTLFWFILVCNLLGLVPLLDLTAMVGNLIGVPIGHHGHGIGGTATQSIWVTAALASVAFIFWNGVALKRDPVGWLAHMTGGAPWYMWPVMIPVELMGLFVKPAALAIRLFANMTGGHILLAVVLGFITQLIRSMGPTGTGLALAPLLGGVAIYMLELLVAFVQAFIFVFLTTIFLGQLVVHEHEGDEHEGDTAHEHLPYATSQGVDQTQSVPLGGH